MSLISKSWVVRLIACWSFVLAVLNLANILLLTRAVEFQDNQTRIWLIFGLDVIFGIGFFLTTYGLWTYKSWGRMLFLWLISIWAVVNILSLVLFVGEYATGELVGNILRFVITLLIPVWYLHRPHVEALFATGSLEEQKY